MCQVKFALEIIQFSERQNGLKNPPLPYEVGGVATRLSAAIEATTTAIVIETSTSWTALWRLGSIYF